MSSGAALVAASAVGFALLWRWRQKGKGEAAASDATPAQQPWSSFDDTSTSRVDVIILGTTFPSLILAAILTVVGRLRVLMLENSPHVNGSSSSALHLADSDGIAVDLNLKVFGQTEWVKFLLSGLLGDDNVLETQALARRFLDVRMGPLRFSLAGTDADVDGGLKYFWDDLRRRCHVGTLSLLVLQLLPRWAAADPDDGSAAARGVPFPWGSAARFGRAVARRVHAGCLAALRSVASETTDDFVARSHPGDTQHQALLRSVLAGAQSVPVGGILPDESSCFLPAAVRCVYERGAHVFRRGTGAVTVALLNAVAAGGGQVYVDVPRGTILLEDTGGGSRKVVGVRVGDGTVLRAGTVVSALGVQATFHSLAMADDVDVPGVEGDVAEEVGLSGDVLDNAVRRCAVLATRVSLTPLPGTAHAAALPAFVRDGFNVVSVPSGSGRFPYVFQGKLTMLQLSYHAFPATVVGEHLLTLLCPQATAGDDGDAAGEAGTWTVWAVGEAPQDWLDTWRTWRDAPSPVTPEVPSERAEGVRAAAAAPAGSHSSSRSSAVGASVDTEPPRSDRDQGQDAGPDSSVRTQNGSAGAGSGREGSGSDDSARWSDGEAAGARAGGGDDEVKDAAGAAGAADAADADADAEECKCAPDLAAADDAATKRWTQAAPKVELADDEAVDDASSRTASEESHDFDDHDYYGEMFANALAQAGSSDHGSHGSSGTTAPTGSLFVATVPPPLRCSSPETFFALFRRACLDRVRALCEEEEGDGDGDGTGAQVHLDAELFTSAALQQPRPGAGPAPPPPGYWACAAALFDDRALFATYLHPQTPVPGLLLCSDEGLFGDVLVAAATAWVTAVHVLGPAPVAVFAAREVWMRCSSPFALLRFLWGCLTTAVSAAGAVDVDMPLW